MSQLFIPVSEDEYSLGGSDALINLIEYGDYECPFSRAGYRYAQLLLKNYGENIRFIFRNFPLKKIHPHAHNSAEAALCAAKMGMFLEMHDLLFENNTHLSEELIYDFAERLELDLYTFKVDMMTDEFKQRIQDDYRGGVKSGVKNTPTFFINGVRYTGENKKG